jgi:two-component system phosphate regulon sensor histidine kinase PhoR
MNRKSLFWHLYPAFLILSLLAVFLVAIQLYMSFKQHAVSDIENYLKEFATSTHRLLLADPSQIEQVHSLFLNRDLSVRILSDSGQIIYSNDDNRMLNQQMLLQPKVVTQLLAMQGNFTLPIGGKQYLNFIQPIKTTSLNGVIHLAFPYSAVEASLLPYKQRLVYSCLLLFILIALASWWYTKSLVQPLQLMQVRTEQMAQGDFSDKIPVQTLQIHEFRSLATSINRMASQIFKRLRTITRQKNEKEAIFSSLTEGVLAVNDRGVVFSLNKSGAKILEYEGKDYKNKSLQSIVRVPELERFIERSIFIKSRQETEIVLSHKHPKQHLMIHTAPLINEKKQQDGVVVTFYDITDMKRLEKVRKDFVANVSHELKTPLTSIQGYAETLLETKNLSSEQQAEFLNTIYKHSTGLSQMVNELLNLAKFEESDQSEKLLKKSNLSSVLESTFSEFESAAKQKSLIYSLDTPKDPVEVTINSALVRQAVSNLISNAIKYTPPEGLIEVSLEVNSENVVVHVKDNGEGIESQHLDRIFERFYRADPARHETTGGSGLGLAIVKHIAKTHSGKVEVSSQYGQGSHFKFSLPLI